ncbi:TIGR03086 family metal-binding protein [Gandjariella thermophila]|uniref:Mycothiol-dependent maleylpyruvate isomerase metal-binding domain-containing protein n=1 Tax=Gandjariella thermophila TaxID=1931992 RepID=A0A4D4JB51_9PSEU|nr:TIGR03086 family metal-binding protein [Gandjariella thermophila]GDY31063.1 hypothetical protein GTS_26960 [Gandjariella thermophila]
MTEPCVPAAIIGGLALLERAVNYTLGSVRLVTPDAMNRETPCRDWDVRALLAHLGDSIEALHEAVAAGWVGLDATAADPEADPVAAVRDRARRLLGACTGAGGHDLVAVAGAPVTTGLVTGAGAIEVAVHGWDVARACGQRRPIPDDLGARLLELAPLLVGDADRPGRFDPPVDVPPLARPADRLVAFLGRRP